MLPAPQKVAEFAVCLPGWRLPLLQRSLWGGIVALLAKAGSRVTGSSGARARMVGKQSAHDAQ